MGFLASPSPFDNVCDVPHRRALRLNSIIPHANLFTDTPACYHRCHNTLTDDQTALPTVAPRVEEVVPPRHTRQGLRNLTQRYAYEASSTADTGRQFKEPKHRIKSINQSINARDRSMPAHQHQNSSSI
ncbi:hypothetical protein T440DRAFT_327749 [Plenodomus tracheiphilus IPT5]|uniref:Uncharacterized protein n=1 Tax=Plenodomus tracheiphilus IPT5 TaxID=1408161 RepID=A0A6A7AMI1_9PLEO|nr:hypothetical protein T440DRAFT_327749 [Plenodomus tracheiphilus IPT5]